MLLIAVVGVLSIWLLRRIGAQSQPKAGNAGGRTQTAKTYIKVDHAVINRLSHEIPYHCRDPHFPIALGLCGPVWVDTEASLRKAASVLCTVKRVAIDVEHHSMHSYFGKTCLIQIATEQTDYLIDALSLWERIPQILGPILANDTILKVVHGGSSDVVWLLRDFGIRLINIFDTEKACRALGYQQFSLAYLLDRFCNVETDKSLQRADWRTRPLSDEQIEYAQTDVHYLLYMADLLLNELMAATPYLAESRQFQPRSPMGRAVRSSQALSLKQWCPVSSKDASMQVAQTVFAKFIMTTTASNDQPYLGTNLQIIGARILSICEWRDAMARELDDGVQCILPDHAILHLVMNSPFLESVKQFKDLVNELAAANENNQHEYCNFPTLVMYNADVLFAKLQICDDSGTLPLTSASDDKGHRKGKDKLLRNEAAAPAAPAAAYKQLFKKSNPDIWKEILGARFGVKKPCYENCKMLSRDNKVLCYTDRKRLLWYVRKGLAEEVNPGIEPLTVRLLFDHKDEDQRAGKHTFYSTARANKCVGCGADRHYLRFRVVPACYRKALPPCLKSHRSHDVVLLCIDCHQIAQVACERTKREIAAETRIPLYLHLVSVPSSETSGDESGGNEKSKQGSQSFYNPFNVRKAAIALQKHGDNLPEARRKELQGQVSTYVRTVEPWLNLSQQDPWDEKTELWAGLLAGLGPSSRRKLIRKWIGEASQSVPEALKAEVDPVISPQRKKTSGESETWCKGHEWHGRAVVELLYKVHGRDGGEEALVALCARFRKSFVDAVKPLYLPEGWSVDHAALRSFGSFSVYATQDH